MVLANYVRLWGIAFIVIVGMLVKEFYGDLGYIAIMYLGVIIIV